MTLLGYEHGGMDACAGDSGAPLFAEVDGEGVIVGITSWGVGCGRPYRPGVYTRVSYYLEWIESVVDKKPTSTSEPNYIPPL